MAKQLVYFSSCAIHPDGTNDPFMVMEQPWLVDHFDQVLMVAHQGAEWLDRCTDAVHHPKKPFLCGARSFWRALFSADVRMEWKRLRKDGHFTPVNALKVLAFAVRGQIMFLAADAVVSRNPADTVLYSCWMSFDAYGAALMKRKYPDMRLVIRGHAFDIDVERNAMNPYLMKQAIADAADGLYFISRMAREQFMSYMQERIDESKVQVLALVPPDGHRNSCCRLRCTRRECFASSVVPR